MSPDPKRIRLELDERWARGVHSAIHEAINAQLLSGDRLDAAREVLEQLESRVAGQLQVAGIGGHPGYSIPTEEVPPGAAVRDDWVVRDADALLDLVYAEHRPGDTAHRASVQAIGRLEDRELCELVDVLTELGLLKMPDVPVSIATWLELTPAGMGLARKRWWDATSASGGRWAFDGPAAPAPSFQPRLPLRIHRDDRAHPVDLRYNANWCPRAPWLQRSSKSRLFRTLKRDGAVQWNCGRCERSWMVYLQAFTADGEPAYGDPAGGAYSRPVWRPTHRD